MKKYVFIATQSPETSINSFGHQKGQIRNFKKIVLVFSSSTMKKKIHIFVDYPRFVWIQQKIWVDLFGEVNEVGEIS